MQQSGNIVGLRNGTMVTLYSYNGALVIRNDSDGVSWIRISGWQDWLSWRFERPMIRLPDVSQPVVSPITTPTSPTTSLTISERGVDFIRRLEGHNFILSNGNYRVDDAGDGKLTTFLGLTIATRQNGIWIPTNGFEQSHIDNRANGIPSDVWYRNYITYTTESTRVLNQYAIRNNLNFTQYQFDALVSLLWNLGYGIVDRPSNDGTDTHYYWIFNYMREPNFLTNPTPDQIYRFESGFGNIIHAENLGGRIPGLWSRRMSELGVFFGNTDANGDYIILYFGDSLRQTAAEWLRERGLPPLAN